MRDKAQLTVAMKLQRLLKKYVFSSAYQVCLNSHTFDYLLTVMCFGGCISGTSPQQLCGLFT